MVLNLSFFNGCFDKGRLKSLISWSILNCGEEFTIELVENLKNLGFEYATKAGISLSLDDLQIPLTKARLVSEAELQVTSAQLDYERGHVTAVEKFQQLIDTWHRTSETLKENVIQYFRATDILNPVYMMAFSGARGNISQVRQLVGMRGLMADPQGQIIEFPIRSNFREGLTLTEYVISCYGARKGLVDTALRTADSGYLTRKLVSVSHHVIVCQFDCGTPRGILLSDMTEGHKITVFLENRLIGRVLAENIYSDSTTKIDAFKSLSSKADAFKPSFPLQGKPSETKFVLKEQTLQREVSSVENSTQNLALKTPNLSKVPFNKSILIAKKGQQISANLARKLSKMRKQVLVRSPLTCEAKTSICQLCYGWTLAHGNLVSLGEAVGILAAQSIGEPGTQLTMRTFHTGGVFSGDVMIEIRAPFTGNIEFPEFLQGVLIRTPHGKIAFLTKVQGEFFLKSSSLWKSNVDEQGSYTQKLKKVNGNIEQITVEPDFEQKKQNFKIPACTILFVRHGELVREKQLIAEFSSTSTQNNQRIQATHNLHSELEGQVFFENVLLGITETKEGDVIRIAKKLGSIWILSGNIYQTIAPTSFFPQPCDLLDTNSVMTQISIMSPYTGFLESSNISKNKNKIINLVKPAVFSFKNITSPSSNILGASSLFFQNKKNKQSFSFLQKKLNLNGIRPTKNKSIVGLLNSKQLNNSKSFSETKLVLKKQALPKENKSFPTNNDLNINLTLNSSILSLVIKSIFYKKIGYLCTFWNKKQLGFNQDQYFLSTSLKQEFKNLLEIKKLLYFHNFPKKYKTQTGGLLFYDSLYFDDNFGQIFWIPEENYKIESQNIFSFPHLKKNEIFIPASNFKTDPFFSNFPGREDREGKLSLSEKGKGLKNSTLFLKKQAVSSINKQWIINTLPILSQQNSQGKVLNLFSKLNGWIHIKLSAKLNNESSLKREVSKYPKNTRLALSEQAKILAFHEKSLKEDKQSYLVTIDGRKYPVIAPPSVKKIRAYAGTWNYDQLKNVFSLQFANSVNKLIFTNLYKSFRRNPYCFNKQSQAKANTFLVKNKLYSSPFNEQRRLKKVTLSHLPFQIKDTKEKFTWFKQFKHYKCKKIFVHHNIFSILKPNFPFIDQLLLNALPSLENKSTTASFLNSLELNKDDKASKFLFQEMPLTPHKSNFYTEKTSLAKTFSDSESLPSPSGRLENYVSHFIQKNYDLNQFKNSILEIKIKPGWVYFPRTQQDLVSFHKQIIKPGFQFIDNVEFDQHVIYLECILISECPSDTGLRLAKEASTLSETYKPYFYNIQLMLKNIDLLKKLNIKKLFNQVDFYASFKHSKNIQRISSLVFQNKLSSKTFNSRQVFTFQFDEPTNFASKLALLAKHAWSSSLTLYLKGENKLANSDKTFPFLKSKAFKKAKSQKLRNLNIFLFQLEQAIQLNENILHGTTQNNSLKPSEIHLLQRQIPDLISLGLLKKGFGFRSDSIIYIKNKNHRYLNLANNQIFNFHKSFMKKFPRKDKPDVLSKVIRFRRFEQSLNRKINKIKNINCLNKSFFAPNFFILIRKIKQYSIPKSSQYKKLLSQSNQTLLERNHFANPSLYSSSSSDRRSLGSFEHLEILTNFSWFNKQIRTKLFSSFPSNDFQIYFSFRFKAYKQINLTKEFNLLEVFILLNIPTIFPLKSAKVGLTSNHRFNRIKTKDHFYSKYPKNTRFSLAEQASKNHSINKYIDFQLFRKIDNSSLMLPELKNKTNHFTHAKLVLDSQNYIFANNPLSFINFFSPYEGEMTALKTDSFGKPSCFFLTDKDKVTFLIKKSDIPCISVGKLIRYGEQIASNLATSQSGQVIQVDHNKIIVRKAQSILFSSKGVFYVHHGDFVERNSPLLTLLYQRLKTGDIVQGIPKIEQLFEARSTEKNEVLPDNLHDKLRYFFEKYKKKYTLQDATRKSLEKIQQILVESVQKVYQSQGVFIADKHLEVIVRQMTSKVKIIEGGQSGLLRGELIDLSWIEMVNKGINSQKAEYEPVILGITKATLEMESFLSAASFQQTPRMLAKAAIARKTDFLRGLNNNVILGQLIPAGTGFSRSFQPENSKYFTWGKQVKLDNLVSNSSEVVDEPN